MTPTSAIAPKNSPPPVCKQSFKQQQGHRIRQHEYLALRIRAAVINKSQPAIATAFIPKHVSEGFHLPPESSCTFYDPASTVPLHYRMFKKTHKYP
jgi:hypothetical protein